MKNLIHFLELEKLFNLGDCLKPFIKEIFKETDKIVIKLHFGEPGHKNFIEPLAVKSLVSILKELNIKPALFDSCVIYHSPRKDVESYLKVAEEHGFSEENIGCPIIISDEGFNVKTEHMDVEVCLPIKEADGMIVLTHVKGHECCGFGASIKNLGMGCVTKKSKKDQHTLSQPKLTGNCSGCGTCIKLCGVKACELDNNKIHFNYNNCIGCGVCILSCPNKALETKVELFDHLLAEAASAVMKTKNKVLFINVINKVSLYCDCHSNPGKIIAKDVGIIYGQDLVAIDKCSFDLIKENEKEDVFEKAHHKSPLLQINKAEELGLGKQEYQLLK
ncbi:MAG: DUF362 domain-containing protein [Nanoarchaeota archaeon]|nr:DUF362 domain-containing protein [Nanoarchaeota archaeon]